MNQRILVIHNPIAGRRRKKLLQELVDLLEGGGHQVTVMLTTQQGDACDIAATVADMDIILVAGGDGTVNEVVNGLCRNDQQGPLPTIGFLPLGTANVLVHELGLPHTPKGLFVMLERGNQIRAYPGIANDHRFFLMVSAGLDARAVAGVTSKLKRKIGGGAYVIAAIKALFASPPLFQVNVDGQEHTARTVVISRARYYGGPFVLAPDGGLNTRSLHVILLKSYGFLSALKYGYGLLTGRLRKIKDVEYMTGMEVSVTQMTGEPVQIDGDIVTNLPLQVRMESRSIFFLVP